MNKLELIEKFKLFAEVQLDTLSSNNPLIFFIKPLINRAIDNNVYKLDYILNFITDSSGNIDADGIISDWINQINTMKPQTFKTEFIGEITIGNGKIELNAPMLPTKLVLSKNDLESLKQLLL